MRTDLWDTDEWLSPSPEDEVRARIRRRARSLGRRRTLPALAALLLAGTMALQQLPGTEQSSYLRVTGEGEQESGEAPSQDEAQATEEEAAGTTTSSSTTTSSTTTTTHRSPRTGIEVGGIGAGIYGPPPTEIVQRDGDEPLFSDDAGDARYHTGCADEPCPDGADLDEDSRSQPAVDFLTGDVRCTDKAMRLSFTLLDPDAPFDANSLGHRVDWVSFDTAMWFDDGTAQGGHVKIELARKVATGELSVRQAYVSVPNEYGTGTGGNIDPRHINPRFVGRALVVDVLWEALAAATEASQPGRRPPGPGTEFILWETAAPYFQYIAGSTYSGGSDNVGYNGWEKRYLLCG